MARKHMESQLAEMNRDLFQQQLALAEAKRELLRYRNVSFAYFLLQALALRR